MKYAKIGERKRGKAELTARRLGGCERCGWTVGVRATHKWNRLEYFLVLREALGRKTQPRREEMVRNRSKKYVDR